MRHLCIVMITLPRQARDKHRENSKKDAFLQTEKDMKLLVHKFLTEFDAEVARRELEVAESVQVRTDGHAGEAPACMLYTHAAFGSTQCTGGGLSLSLCLSVCQFSFNPCFNDTSLDMPMGMCTGCKARGGGCSGEGRAPLQQREVCPAQGAGAGGGGAPCVGGTARCLP